MKKILLSIFLTLNIAMLSVAQSGFQQEGKASFYADKFEGRTTASGEKYSHQKATCAHLNLPFGTLVKVTNIENGKYVVVRVNDRGPFAPDRIIDLSRSAAEKLDFVGKGLADVRIEVLDEYGNPTTKIPVTVDSKIEQPKETTPTEKLVDTPKPKQEEPKPAPQPETKKPVLPQELQQPEVSPTELYSISIDRQEPKGFALQIGSYKELVNLLRIANDLKESLKKEVRVQVVTIGNDKVYRLLVGSFSSRAEADKFKAKAASIYPDCFVTELK
ncbi:MAG: septal ring lytic transglycosylase RlpA family protein [Tenuifilaceae bacterium]|jgi:rare lipoprotein A|nr:septal ring lytic transglycosylase RlpA family protein [Tenuifilaceae bacterium]